MVEISVIGIPLLFIPVCMGLLCLMVVLIFAKTKLKESLVLAGILFVLFGLSFQTFKSLNVERLIFFSTPFHIGTLVTIGAFLSTRLLLFTKLEWKRLFPEFILFVICLLLLSLPETVAGSILSILLGLYGVYRIWGCYQYSNFNWTFASYIIFGLLGLFGFIGLWFPFNGGRILYSFFLVLALVIMQLQLLDYVMDRLKTASVSSITDPLTGLYNKGFLLKKAAQIGESQVFSVIFADIDNFKILNDTKGHDHGDIILKDTAKILQSVLGEEGYACRFGGEELVGLVLTDDAAKKAEKFRSLVEKRLGVTVSVGVATGTKDGAGVITEADLAMYEAKNSGKNRVVVAGESGIEKTIEDVS